MDRLGRTDFVVNVTLLERIGIRDMADLQNLRALIYEHHLMDERLCLEKLQVDADISPDVRKAISRRAAELIENIRSDERPSLMEVFLAEYGISTDEGVALMSLAEALLRVPDGKTVDELIEDKIRPHNWRAHKGHSESFLVNNATRGLLLTQTVLNDKSAIGRLVKRMGRPFIRKAVTRIIKSLGGQFVLGQSISKAVARGRSLAKQGYTFSYDMLGEAALTQPDADKYFEAYKSAIAELGQKTSPENIHDSPGISIKLSALHPRYEQRKSERVLNELVPRVLELCKLAKKFDMGLNIDAEEADRLDISLSVIEATLHDEDLSGWAGLGVVVQAYGKRAGPTLDWLYALSKKLDRQIMVRLVKGAYWDSEIKKAQVDGLSDFPVFTSKSATDISYLCCTKKLLGMTDRIYPQFATHNAHSAIAVLELGGQKEDFEYQRLHGMGESLHRQLRSQFDTRCRIYAPVGVHEDLLAYLVRRLLENGANSSFVNQIVDSKVSASDIAVDPFDRVAADLEFMAGVIKKPSEVFEPSRRNSEGHELNDVKTLAFLEEVRRPFQTVKWTAGPIIARRIKQAASESVSSPVNVLDKLGTVVQSSEVNADAALKAAKPWTANPTERRNILLNAAKLFEDNRGELFALLAREAGKTLLDAEGELREAVDFLYYYGAQLDQLPDKPARGIFTCISPWNFPLAIFTGQVAAALAAGNAVLAKPAESTPIIAYRAVELLHQAGVPKAALQFLPGAGRVIGAKLVSDPRISGVCFTGSTATAQAIHRNMAKHLSPDAPFIAETGGLNAMIADSTALPEQAVKDIVDSAFQSAGQRCSALRILYVQEDVAPKFLDMLFGAMDELTLGNPWSVATDIGPLITEQARIEITEYVERAKKSGRVRKQIQANKDGFSFGPTVISVDGIAELEREIFGPVLHVATFKSGEIDKIVEDVNTRGFGLTFGLHSRIDGRVDSLSKRLKVGNLYVNRNQIGAIVGSQPFGGEGLSGTGPKAGGPAYVNRFYASKVQKSPFEYDEESNSLDAVQAIIDDARYPQNLPTHKQDLPGPTGESNRLSIYPKGVILCMGPGEKITRKQAAIVEKVGSVPLCVTGFLPELLTNLSGFDGVAYWGSDPAARQIRQALAERDGAILPLYGGEDMENFCHLERHLCIDTTASGGNVSLLGI